MTNERYQKIMADLGIPNSRSLLQALPQQVPNEHGHLLTTQALWGMYVEDIEPPNAELTSQQRESKGKTDEHHD